MSRISLPSAMMQIAWVLSQRATCQKLGVGCVLLDKNGRILSGGYNGVPSGWAHCTDKAPCTLVSDRCWATHAESNALLSCHAPTSEVHACIVTHSPCLHCCKQLIQTGCKHIIYEVPTEELDLSKQFWLRHIGGGRTFSQTAAAEKAT